MVAKRIDVYHVGWLPGVLLIVISMALWRARCAAIMEGIKFILDDVIRFVKFLLRDISSKIKEICCLGEHDCTIMEMLACPIIPIDVRKIKLVS